jgi:tellurite resistance-related uncharacterized protein
MSILAIHYWFCIANNNIKRKQFKEVHMKTLPGNLKFKRRTPEFTHRKVPKGILGQHRTAEGVWGKIKVTEGSLIYRILEPDVAEYELDAAREGIVAPQDAHQVEIKGPVKFHVEFYQQAD